MIERASGIYEVTLRSGMGKGVGEIRIYVIPGTFGGRSLMIDTGFGEEGCLPARSTAESSYRPTLLSFTSTCVR